MDVYLATDELQACVLTCISPIYKSQLAPMHSETARVKYIRIEADGAMNTTEVLTYIVITIAVLVFGCCCCIIGAKFFRRRGSEYY
jgi:hypothetical protein